MSVPLSERNAAEELLRLFVATRRWCNDHKFLVMGILIGLLATVIVVGPTAMPASAATVDAPSGYASPAEWENYYNSFDSVNDGTRVLAWHRWWTVNSVPFDIATGDPIAAAMVMALALFANIFLLIASLIMFLVGQLVVLLVSVNLLERSTNFVDALFARVGYGFVSGTGGSFEFSGESVGIIFMTLIILILISLNAMRKAGRGGDPMRAFMKPMLSGVAIMCVLGIMTYQAAANHPKEGSSQYVGQGQVVDISGMPDLKEAEDKEYAPMSPGWFINFGLSVSHDMASWVATATKSLSDGVADLSSGQVPAACNAYVDAMHEYYPTSAKVSPLPLAYDAMATAMYFNTWRIASFGDNSGGQNSWCRIVEAMVGTSAPEQVVISRKAGLYRELIGTSDSDGFAVTQGMEWAKVNDDSLGSKIFSAIFDNWAKSKGSSATWEDLNGPSLAMSILGPTYPTSTSASRASNYWAACIWAPGKDVSINPEWANVRLLPSENYDSDNWFGNLLNKGKFGIDKIFGTYDKGQEFKLSNCTDVMKEGFSSPAAAAFQFTDVQVDDPMGGAFFSFKISSMAPFFQNAPIAYDYWLSSQGKNISIALPLAGMAVALMVAVGKFVLPIAIGGLIAQGIGIVSWILMPIVLLVLITWTNFSKTLFRTVLMSIAWSFFAVILYVAIMGVYTSVYSILFALFYDAKAMFTLQVIQTGLAAFVTFYAVKTLLKNSINYDMSSFKGAVMSAGMIAGKGALTAAGKSTPAVFKHGGEGEKKRRGFNPAKALNKKFQGARDIKDDTTENGNNAKSALDNARNAWAKRREAAKKKKESRAETAKRMAEEGKTESGSQLNKIAGDKSGSGSGNALDLTSDKKNAKSADKSIDKKSNSETLVNEFVDKDIPRQDASVFSDSIDKMSADELNVAANGGTKKKKSDLDEERVEDQFGKYGPNSKFANDNGAPKDASSIEASYLAANVPLPAPMTKGEIDSLPPSEREAYLRGDFDKVGVHPGITDGTRMIALPWQPDATWIKAPGTDMYVPNGALTHSDSRSREAVETENGARFTGIVRDENSETGFSPLAFTSRALPDITSIQCPPGVDPGHFALIRDFTSKIRNDPSIDVTNPSSWPAEDREQLVSLAPYLENIFNALAVEVPDLTDEEVLRGTFGSASTKFFGDGVPTGGSGSDLVVGREVMQAAAKQQAIGLLSRIQEQSQEAAASIAANSGLFLTDIKEVTPSSISDDQVASIFSSVSSGQGLSEDIRQDANIMSASRGGLKVSEDAYAAEVRNLSAMLKGTREEESARVLDARIQSAQRLCREQQRKLRDQSANALRMIDDREREELAAIQREYENILSENERIGNLTRQERNAMRRRNEEHRRDAMDRAERERAKINRETEFAINRYQDEMFDAQSKAVREIADSLVGASEEEARTMVDYLMKRTDQEKARHMKRSKIMSWFNPLSGFLR